MLVVVSRIVLLFAVHALRLGPNHVVSGCTWIMEFFCAKQNVGWFDSQRDGNNHNDDKNNLAHVWCRQICRIVLENKKVQETMTHPARLCFLRDSKYVVVVCAKITAVGHMCKGIWWASKAEPIVVVIKASQ